MFNADQALMTTTAGLIELAATRHALGKSASWQPGAPFRLLFAGYTGTRNTGADVRVDEMIRQVRHLLGDELADLSIFTMNRAYTRGYFRTVKQVPIPEVFPRTMYKTIDTMHGVIACEGSMFKSRFANALTTMMVGSLGLAVAQDKVAVAYGGEAGAMDPPLQDLVRRYVPGSLVITRNQASTSVLADLGVQSEVGTDTAWTFTPSPAHVGAKILADHGWDGRTPVLALCPINPFWWPVRADPARAASQWITGVRDPAHFKSVYFHNSGPEVNAAQAAYLDAIAQAVRRFQRTHRVFPIAVGMEALDRAACEGLSARLDDAPVIVSDQVNMYDMVSVLWRCQMLVSSRYHACVTSMPGGVPSAGITMDERIRNLMADRGQPELALEVDDPHLGERLFDVLHRLHDDAESIRSGVRSSVADNLHRMGVMGQWLVDHLRQRHPQLPLSDHLGSHGDPWDHLPTLPANLVGIHAGTTR